MTKNEHLMADLQAFVRDEASTPKKGEALAKAIYNCFVLNFRKQTFYVPSTVQRQSEIEKRNQAIVREFTGNNHNHLANKYRLSVQSIYNIINAARRKNETGEKPLKPILLLVIDEYLTHAFIVAGLDEAEAISLSQKVADYLLDKYPGTMFRMCDLPLK